MSSETLNTDAIVVAVLATYVLMAIGILRLGEWLRERFPRTMPSRFGATVHVLALFSFLIGCLLAWMAYASDNPMKGRQLFLPVILPAIVYGVVVVIWVRSLLASFVVKGVLKLLSRGEGKHGL